MKTTNLLIIALLMIFAFPLQAGGETAQAENPAVVMCRPTTDQIKNIAVMRSAGLFGDIKFDLICVYHENELTGYDSSRKYVSGSGLKWVSFAELKGRVEVDGLFRENVWTSQFREIFEASDGIIFTGGMDIPPGIYLEKNSLLTEATTPYRTLYETSFLFHLIGGSRNSGFRPFLEDDPEYPVLGICLGSQTMNVAAGGSLVQDIPSELYGLRTVEQVLRLEQDKIHSSRYVKLMYPGSRN
ncbi:MAG: gamma-glutamyl-gamma-aminobutyrate hydrolase family protein, partial [Acidobacteriota bacterium]